MLPRLRILRITSRSDGMFGVAIYDDGSEPLPFALTGEDAWKENKPGISCIPAGAYTARRYDSPKFGYEVFLLVDVHGRSDIELHVGNTQQDIEGCIYIGASYEVFHGTCGLGGSKAAFAEFMQLFAGREEIEVVIEDAWGGTTRVIH